MPPATTTSCGRPESSFCQFLALGNSDADSITIEARDMALFKDLAAQMVLASAAAAIDGAAAAGAGSSA